MSQSIPSNLPSDPAVLPRHIAIIMDGNGRWAKRRLLPRVAGHREGVKAVRRVVEVCSAMGIEALTLFAFSSENWRRPGAEVEFLMDLFINTLQRQVEKLHRNGVRLQFIGDRSGFSRKLCGLMNAAETLTASNSGLVLTVAANYGGRWDLTHAARRLAVEVAAGQLKAEEITPDVLAQHLSLPHLPDPDLFIRTGGEQRVSNFLLWQLAYTELYFTDTLWPDFDRACLARALESFAGRQRRFGRTGDQVEQIKGA